MHCLLLLFTCTFFMYYIKYQSINHTIWHAGFRSGAVLLAQTATLFYLLSITGFTLQTSSVLHPLTYRKSSVTPFILVFCTSTPKANKFLPKCPQLTPLQIHQDWFCPSAHCLSQAIAAPQLLCRVVCSHAAFAMHKSSVHQSP